MLLKANLEIVLAISLREQVTFRCSDDYVRFVLDQHS